MTLWTICAGLLCLLTFGFGSVADAQTIPLEVLTDQPISAGFTGFGAEWDSMAYTAQGVNNQDFALITKRVKWMRLPVARIMMLCKWCYLGDGRFDFETKEMKDLYRHLDVCQEIGTRVFLTDWGVARNWTSAHEVTKVSDPKYAEIIGRYLDHLINKKGYKNIRNFILVNEPNLEAGGWDEWRAGVVNVQAMFKKRGFDRRISFTASDCAEDVKWHQRTVDELRSAIGTYDMHFYAPDALVRAGGLQKFWEEQWEYALQNDPFAPGKSFIVGEAGMRDGSHPPQSNDNITKHEYGVFMADYAVQAANAGTSAVSAWMLDDNSHTGFGWGLWASKKDGLALRPWFYPWSLLCRCFPRGSVIYEVGVPSKDLRVMVARGPRKGVFRREEWSACLVNRAESTLSVNLSISNGPRISAAKYVYSPDSKKADENGFPVPISVEKYDLKKGAQIECPGNGVVFLTTIR